MCRGAGPRPALHPPGPHGPEFNRLASKVHKNEQRTSILQTLCEQLRKENEALKAKLDKGLEQRDQAAERLREENLELKKLLMSNGNKEGASGQPGSPKMEGQARRRWLDSSRLV